jgi:hypothetical protein
LIPSWGLPWLAGSSQLVGPCERASVVKQPNIAIVPERMVPKASWS